MLPHHPGWDGEWLEHTRILPLSCTFPLQTLPTCWSHSPLHCRIHCHITRLCSSHSYLTSSRPQSAKHSDAGHSHVPKGSCEVIPSSERISTYRDSVVRTGLGAICGFGDPLWIRGYDRVVPPSNVRSCLIRTHFLHFMCLVCQMVLYQ